MARRHDAGVCGPPHIDLLEDNVAFTTPVTPRNAVWEPDPAFGEASYADRYVIFFERMVRERLF